MSSKVFAISSQDPDTDPRQTILSMRKKSSVHSREGISGQLFLLAANRPVPVACRTKPHSDYIVIFSRFSHLSFLFFHYLSDAFEKYFQRLSTQYLHKNIESFKRYGIERFQALKRFNTRLQLMN